MASVPNELEQVMSDLKTCMNVYEILSQFGYKFHEEEDYDKKWRLFGSPKETIEKIEK